ncbi:unnamed protein product [Paramecium pentaurelia]|uniref:Uncharacterized protein n=1 Tax=Paramecium pentaurelia TaxID=43138 RepID=A0A8S1TQ45_9CILI|nr:unnamed protein product [Paramecium pentaurelia]
MRLDQICLSQYLQNYCQTKVNCGDNLILCESYTQFQRQSYTQFKWFANQTKKIAQNQLLIVSQLPLQNNVYMAVTQTNGVKTFFWDKTNTNYNEKHMQIHLRRLCCLVLLVTGDDVPNNDQAVGLKDKEKNSLCVVGRISVDHVLLENNAVISATASDFSINSFIEQQLYRKQWQDQGMQNYSVTDHTNGKFVIILSLLIQLNQLILLVEHAIEHNKITLFKVHSQNATAQLAIFITMERTHYEILQEVGEYLNGKRKGNWIYISNNKKSVHFYEFYNKDGQYNQQGQRVAKWTYLNDDFNKISQVAFDGEYKNGKKGVQLDISNKDYCYNKLRQMQILQKYYIQIQRLWLI